MYFSLFMRIISIKSPTFQIIKFEAGDLLLFLKNIVFSPQNGCYSGPKGYYMGYNFFKHVLFIAVCVR